MSFGAKTNAVKITYIAKIFYHNQFSTYMFMYWSEKDFNDPKTESVVKIDLSSK